jgi:hypothetical protein
MRFARLFVSTTFIFLIAPDVSAGPYIGATLNNFDTAQSDTDPVDYGSSIGTGFAIGNQTYDSDASLFYGVELEYSNVQWKNGWGGRIAGLFGTLRTESRGMGYLLLRIGAVNTQIQFSGGASQDTTNAAIGLGWGAMVSESIGFELSSTGILGKVVGSGELDLYGIRLLYAW